MEKTFRPSNFDTREELCFLSSGFNHCEYEIMARNIVIILKNSGDEWRPFSWKEYKSLSKEKRNKKLLSQAVVDIPSSIKVRCIAEGWVNVTRRRNYRPNKMEKSILDEMVEKGFLNFSNDKFAVNEQFLTILSEFVN